MADRPKEPDEFSAAPPAYTRKQRVEMAKKGWAIPILDDSGEILDGSCPIASTNDLTNAIRTLDQLKDKTGFAEAAWWSAHPQEKPRRVRARLRDVLLGGKYAARRVRRAASRL